MSSAFHAINRSSIFFKTLAMIVFVVAAVTGTNSYLNYGSTLRQTEHLVMERGLAEAKTAGDNLYGPTRFGDAEKATHTIETMLAGSDGQGVAAIVLSIDGTVLAQSVVQEGNLDALLENVKINFEAALRAPVVNGSFIMVPIQQVASPKDPLEKKATTVGVFAVNWSHEVGIAEVQPDLWKALWIALTIAIATIGMSLWATAKAFIKPITDLREAIQKIGQGHLDVLVPGTKRKDELGSISATVEELRATLKSSEGIRLDAAYKSAAFSAASASLMLLDSDFKIRYVNPAMSEFLKTHRQHVPSLKNKGESHSVIGLHLDDFHANGSQIRDRLAHIGNETFNTTVSFGEARVSLSISAVYDEQNNRIGLILEWLDITRDWLNKAILDAIDSDQMRADFTTNGELLWANAPMCEAMGVPLSELQGTSFRNLVGNTSESRPSAEYIMSATLENSTYKEQMILKTHSGMEIIVEGSFSCVRDTSNKPIRFMLLGRDSTKQINDIKDAHAARASAENEQNQVVDALRIGLRKLSNGDLTALIKEPFAGSYEDLRVDYNQTVETLATAMREIAESAESIKNESGDISSTADGLSRRTENTAATLEQTAAALDELTSSVKVAAQGAAEADKAVREAKLNAEQSGEVVLETVSAMDLILESSERITSIIKVIDDIAFQTNLLALNAGVEAARAGDAGRGFAVVASEVRALAQRSSDAAREINELIAKSGGQVKRGVDLVGKTGGALQSIVASVSKISVLVSRIADSSQQQSLNLAEINQSVNQLDQSTQQNAARLEETTAASESLRKDAVALVQTVSHFRLKDEKEIDDSVVSFRAKPRNTSLEKSTSKTVRTAMSSSSAAIAGWEDF